MTSTEDEVEGMLKHYPALILSISNTKIVLNAAELIRTGCAEDIILYLAGRGYKPSLQV